MASITQCRCGKEATKAVKEFRPDEATMRANDADHLATLGHPRQNCQAYPQCPHPAHNHVKKYTGRFKAWCDTCERPKVWPKREGVT